jgi:fucose permease
MAESVAKTRISHISFRLQVGLAFGLFILIGANDGTSGVLIPSMGTFYQIDKSTVSLIFLFSTLGYLIASVNSGLLMRKLGVRRFLLMGAIIVVVSMFLLSLTPPFFIFAACLLPLGFGISNLDTGLNAYIAGLPRSTVLLNYLHAFYGAGAWLAPIVASAFLAVKLPWNSVYVVWATLCFILTIAIALIFKSRSDLEVAASKTGIAERYLLSSLLKQRLTWIFSFFLFFYVGVEIVIGSWSYSFFTEQRHIFTLYAGWIVSGYWLGLMLGRLVLGHVAQRFGEKHTIQCCVFGAGVGILLVWLSPISLLAAFGLCLTGFCLGPIFPTTIAMTTRMVSTDRVGTMIGFLVSIGCVGGAFLPWLAGNLAQFVGVWSVMPYAIILVVCLLSIWLILQLWLKKDRSFA